MREYLRPVFLFTISFGSLLPHKSVDMSPRSKVPASSKKVESDDVDIRLPPINVMEQPLYETPGYQPPFQQGQLQNVYNDGQSRHGPFIPASDISLSSSSSASTRRLGVPSIRDILNEEAPTPEWNPILFASISALPTSRQRSGNIESNSSGTETSISL